MAIKWYGKELSAEIMKAQLKAVARGGAILEREIKLSMRDTTTRKTRGLLRQKARGKRKAKYHYPSESGHPPAVDTGRLRASITFQTSNGTKSDFKPAKTSKNTDPVGKPTAGPTQAVCIVGTNVKYGKYLELGTRHIRPRPFLRPALENKQSDILDQFVRLF